MDDDAIDNYMFDPSESSDQADGVAVNQDTCSACAETDHASTAKRQKLDDGERG